MSRLIIRVVEVNKYIFPLLIGLAFVSSGLETYSYLGFLSKYILVDSRFFLVLAMISGTLLIGKKLNTLCALTFKVNTFILPVSLTLYLIMQLLESLHFHNYVFSTYHIQQTNFLYIVFLSSALFLISKLVRQKPFLLNMSVFKLAIVFIFTVVFLDGAVKTMDAAVYTDIYILSHINASYDFKMEERWGLYYDYIKFVKANTPENASILVPPQELPWFSTGNVGLNRYFLFPRKMGNGSYNEPMDLSNYDYVLLVWGEWDGADKSAYGWPKIPIKAEKIIYFESATGVVREKNGNYDPKSITTDGVWGIIKVKK